MINDRDSKEINQALPVRHPGTIEPGAVIAIVAALEFLGVLANHALHWPWWIGAQLPVAYLMWQWSKERSFAHRLANAWNEKLRPDRGPRPAEHFTIEQANEFIRKMESRSDETE